MPNLPEPTSTNPRARTLVPAGGQPIALAEHVRVARAGAPTAGNSVEDWIAHLIDRAGMRWRGTWAVQTDLINYYIFGDLVRDGDQLWTWGDTASSGISVRPGAGTSGDHWDLIYEPPRAWFRGSWSADERYEGNDWAEWNGQLFRAIHDIFPAANNPVPANSGDWQPIDLWRGVWDGHGRYAPGSIVTANGQLWMTDIYLDEHDNGPDVNAHWHRISTPQAAQLAALLSTLTGDARLSYTALKDQPRTQHVDNWETNRQYLAGDLTVWNEMLFRCTADVNGVQNPNVDPDHWNPIENYRGVWNDHNAYSVASFVAHEGHLYVSTIQFDPLPGTTTNEPGHNAAWVQISPQSPAQIVQNLVALAGDDRLPYSAIRDTPAPSTFVPRTNDEIDARIAIPAQRNSGQLWDADKLGHGTHDATTVLYGDQQFRVPARHVERIGVCLANRSDWTQQPSDPRTSYSYFAHSGVTTSQLVTGDRYAFALCPHDGNGQIMDTYQNEIEDLIWFRMVTAIPTVTLNHIDPSSGTPSGIWVPMSAATSDVPHATTGLINRIEPERMTLLAKRADGTLVTRQAGAVPNAPNELPGWTDFVVYHRIGW